MGKSIEIRRATQEASALVLGVAQSTLRTWKDAPRNQDGTYDLPVLNAWHIARKLAEGDPDGGGSGEKSEALEEFRRWKAKQAKLDYEKATGELLPALDVRAEAARVAGVVKQRLLSMPALLAARVQGLPVDQCAHAMELEIRDVLDELEQALRVEVVDEEREAV